MTLSTTTGDPTRPPAEPIWLKEYESTVVSLPAGAVGELQTLAGHRLRVRPEGRPDTWKLTATSYVGTLVTPAVSVLIRPKIPLENLFLLLDVDLPTRLWSDLPFGYDESPDDLLVAFAELFARQAKHTLGRGVLPAYREHRAQEVALRGRVDIPDLFGMGGVPTPVPCRYDELSVDIAENRYLRAAARRLLDLPGVHAATRARLRQVLAALDGVADVSPPPEALDQIHLTRLNRHYESGLRLARLVLANRGLADRRGAHSAAAFMLDMNALFQTWVTQRLRRHLRSRLTVDSGTSMSLGHQDLVAMHPDLVFRRNGEVVHVGDVKYKLVTTGFGRAPDYYQLLAYATVTGAASGVLIYCQADGDVPPREVVVRRGGQRLCTYPLDLRGRRDEVEEAMAAVASWIVGEV